MKNLDIINRAARWAKKRGLKKIKANCEAFETPTQYHNPDREKPFIPDVTGTRRGGRKYYVEIALKTEKVARKISKWKLLSTLASMKGGKLFLLAPKGHKAFTDRIVNKHNLNAEVVYLADMQV